MAYGIDLLWCLIIGLLNSSKLAYYDSWLDPIMSPEHSEGRNGNSMMHVMETPQGM